MRSFLIPYFASRSIAKYAKMQYTTAMAKAKQSAKKSKEDTDEKDVKKSSSKATSEKKDSKKKESEKPATKKVEKKSDEKSEKKTDSKKAAKSSEEKKKEENKDVKKTADKTEKKESSTKKKTADTKTTKKVKKSKKSAEKDTEELEENESNRGIIIAMLVLIVLLAGVIGYSMFGPGFGGNEDDTQTNTNTEVYVDIDGNVVEEDSPAAIIPRRIDGMMVAREDANDIPSCVMIENAAFGGVRPQSGLNSASVVYEVIVEGGITRFMAVFAGEQSDEVGPIRSARDTYLEFASEYDCMYTHAGGSYTAMTAIPRFGLRDLDALRESQFFWRDSGRYAPHNLFSSTANLEEAIVAHSWHLEDEPEYESWNFVEAIGAPDTEAVAEVEDAAETEETAVEAAESANTENEADTTTDAQETAVTLENGTEAVNQLQILFGGSYNSQYDYNEEGNYYERTNGGVLQTDAATGETLRTNNIVVMHVGSGTSIEGKGRINWPVTGEGDVEIFHDGRVYYGTWKKPSRTERTQFYDADGELLPLVQGNTWVEVVPPHITVEKN